MPSLRPPLGAVPAVALAALALAAPAQAAFAPVIDVRLDPARAGARPAIAAVVTQLPGETPLRRLALRLPPGFALNLAWAGTPCAPEAEAARACPAESRVGTVDLVSRVGGTASGPVHLAPNGRLVAFASGAAGILDQTLHGEVTPRRSGLDIAIDGLPALPLAGAALRFDGGARALVVNPAACGEAQLLGLATSHLGELAVTPDTVQLDGCTGPVRVTRARVSRSRFRPVRRFADRERPGYGTTLSWRQSAATGPTRVRIERRSGRRWRRVGSLLATAAAGANALRFDGRLERRPLRAGPYRFVIVPRGSRPAAAVRFTVLR